MIVTMANQRSPFRLGRSTNPSNRILGMHNDKLAGNYLAAIHLAALVAY